MPEFAEGQTATCHDCSGQIRFHAGYWEHIPVDGAIPKHPAVPYDRLKKVEEAARRLIDEAQFVISGGDDPHDRCPDCGCAGYGMLRDAITDAKKVLEGK